MMLKEHIIEAYGQIRYTIGRGLLGRLVSAAWSRRCTRGCSTGIMPNCTFTDLWTTVPDVVDCGLIVHYSRARRPAARRSGRGCRRSTATRSRATARRGTRLFYNNLDPTNAGHCKLDATLVYNPDTNPGGVRCTMQDYMESIFGPRPQSEWTAPEKKIGHGFANRPWGNEGVQYGLKALQDGQITPDEFVDLNAKIGGLTIDEQAAGRAHGGRREHGGDRLPDGAGDGREVAS